MRTLKNEMNEKQTEQGGLALKKIAVSLTEWLKDVLCRVWRVFVKEVKTEAAECLTERSRASAEWQAAEELMWLYRAWLGYLLSRLEENEVHVPVSDICCALNELSCTTVREGDEYVIRIQRNSGEVTVDGADSNTECHE